MDRTTKEIIDISGKLISEIVARDKRPMLLPDGHRIYRFELHVIEHIGAEEGISVNELARVMGVTKGAISQVVTKLCNNGLAEKVNPANNRKTVNLYLSEKGRKVFEGHRAFHEELNKKIALCFSKYSVREIDLLKTVLSDIHTMLSGL